MNDIFTPVILTLLIAQFPVMLLSNFARKRIEQVERQVDGIQKSIISILESQTVLADSLTEISKSRNTTRSESSASRIE